MSLRARFRPHPRGFGFANLVAEDNVTGREVKLPDGDGGSTTVDSIFVPPPLASGQLADDLVDVEYEINDRGVTATSLTTVQRPRRMVVGRVVQGPGRLVVEPDGSLGSGWVELDASLTPKLQLAVGRQVVVLTSDDADGRPVGRAIVAGPHVAGSPSGVRAASVVVALGSADPSTIPGGAAAAGLTTAEAAGTATRIVGILAAGGRGGAAGLDLEGVVPGADLVPVDRTEEITITIDDADTRDVDDALTAGWDGTPEGPVTVVVHIADVAGAVGIDSAADRYARVMASTAYLTVGDNAPMLDPALSEDALSLLPGVERGSLSISFSVAPDGSVTDAAVELATITSDAKCSYAALDAWLDGDGGPLADEVTVPGNVEAVGDVVGALVQGAARLGVARDARTTMEDLFTDVQVEPAVVDGKLRTRAAERHAAAYRVVERLMVAANEAVAGWLVAQDVPALYRAHTGLAVDRLARLRAAVALAEQEVPGLAGAGVPSLAAADDEVDTDLALAEALATIEALGAGGHDDARDLLVAVITGSVARATYEPDPSAHRGLAAEAYVHYTSPIRRYADLVVHRQLRATLAGEVPPYTTEDLGPLAGWVDARSGATGWCAARERNELWAILLDRGFLDAPEPALVTGITTNGLRIRVPRIGQRGFVPAEAALGLPRGERGSFEVDEHELTTTSGPWRVGSRVAVRATGVDNTGRVNWQLA